MINPTLAVINKIPVIFYYRKFDMRKVFALTTQLR